MSDQLINTLECPGEFDALATLRPGEPYFLLVGRDRQAPSLVLQWAKANRLRALDEYDRKLITRRKRDDELRKSTQAEEIAWSMQSFKEGREKEEVAAKADPSPTYPQHDLPEDTKRRDMLQSLSVRAAASLNNAVGEVDPLVQFLGEAYEAGDARAREMIFTLSNGIDAIRVLADFVKPSRPINGGRT